MNGSKVFVLIASVFALTFCTSNNLQTVADQGVRLSWDDMSDEQQTNYLNAVMESMDRGLHARFAQIHSNKKISNTAHRDCSFMLWHRKFLLAYEGMLQDMGKGDAMLPYWNYFADHDYHMDITNECQTWAECSNYLNAHGGSDGTAPIKEHTLFGAKTISGHCVSDRVAGHACSDPAGISSGNCEGCILRSNWAFNRTFLDLNKGNIIGMLEIGRGKGISTTHKNMSANALGGFHAQVHNNLNKTMASMIAPFDPIFFGHHATIDLIGFIHNHCLLKNDDQSSEKHHNEIYSIFEICELKKNGTIAPGQNISPDTDILFLYNDRPADQDPDIGKYFQETENTYSSVKDTENLSGIGQGSNYKYKLDGYLTKFLREKGIICPEGIFADDELSLKAHLKHEKEVKAGKIDDCKGTGLMDILLQCQKEFEEHAQALGGTSTTICVRQTDILECEATRQRRGVDFESYSDEFRESFQLPDDVTDPPCKTILDKVDSGELKILVTDKCRELYGKATDTKLTKEFFGKPLPFPKDIDYKQHGKTVDFEANQVHVRIQEY